MNTVELIRQDVISSFNIDNGAFSNMSPYEANGFIDGAYMTALLAYASKKVGDAEMLNKCTKYLDTLHKADDNARTYASYQVSSSWRRSRYIKDIWVKIKPQAFIANAMATLCVKNGIDVPVCKNIRTLSKLMDITAPLFGYLIRFIKPLRQHLNSYVLNFLLLDKIPPKSMEFLAKDNMIYSYIYKKKCDVLYKNTGIAPQKDYPDSNKPISNKPYTPIMNLIGKYLQKTLD